MMNPTELLGTADLSTSRPLDLRGYSTCTNFEYIESKSRAWYGVSLRDRRRLVRLTIVAVTGSSSVSTPEYLYKHSQKTSIRTCKNVPSLDLNTPHSLPVGASGRTIGADVARHVLVRRSY